MERWVGKVAIVTGASSGIGEAITRSLVKSGMIVVGLARRVEYIEKISRDLVDSGAKGKLYSIQCDIRIEEDILKAFDWTCKNIGNIYVLINSAGLTTKSILSEGATNDWRQILETNVLGLCIATREAVNVMKTHNIEGQIIHINSIVGHNSLFYPTIGMYGPSKHAVTSMTDILRFEMVAANTNIKVTSISPGLVKTDIFHAGNVTEEVSAMLNGMPVLETQDVADGVMYILGVPHRVHINELTLRATNFPM